jgi:hypothetical protein
MNDCRDFGGAGQEPRGSHVQIFSLLTTTIQERTIMPRKHYTIIHPAAKDTLVQLSQFIPVVELAWMCDIHPQSLERAIALYELTGEVAQSKKAVGRPRVLEEVHEEVCASFAC